jgi:hypothetical protein
MIGLVPIEMPPGERKYTTEFTLVVAVQGAYLLRAQDLRHVSIEAIDQDHPCHLYVISRTPRVSIHPQSVDIDDDAVRGVVSVHRQGEVDERGFVMKHALGEGVTWESTWPHEEFSILDRDGNRVQGGVCALIGALTDDWPQAAALHEILYVGQAYGRAGERTAWDRLRSHETLQRILADQPPDTQVWLTMATVCDVQIVQEISPTPGSVCDDVDNQHILTVLKRVYGEGFQDREAVALAEAGLIRGWQPEYNDRLKHNFPARQQTPLDTARDLDLHGLVVEWQSTDLPARYFCGKRDPSRMFFFGYEVHLEKGRAETLSLRTLRAPLLGGLGRAWPNLIPGTGPEAEPEAAPGS